MGIPGDESAPRGNGTTGFRARANSGNDFVDLEANALGNRCRWGYGKGLMKANLTVQFNGGK